MTYTELLEAMTGVSTVSGSEPNIFHKLQVWMQDYFDEIRYDNAQNMILIRRCGRETPRKIMLDAHLDEIGMMVNAVQENGFLSVSPVGGIDRQILPGADCTITGKNGSIPGVIAVPHDTQSKGASNNKSDFSAFPIDTGYTKEELEKLGIGIGAVVSFSRQWTKLLNRRITGQGFDDKCCGACLLSAVMETPQENLIGDVYVVLSSREEVGGHGADCAAFGIEPDIAIVTDVNFASTPGMAEAESSPLGDGPMISLSAVTDRGLTEKILDLARKTEIPLHAVVEATNTGTNANSLVYCQTGIPTAVVSIPLANMHAYNECLSLNDCEAFIRLIQAIITCPGMADGYDILTERGTNL